MNTRVVEETYKLIDYLSGLIKQGNDEELVSNAKKCIVYFVNQLYEEESKNKKNTKSREFYEQILVDNGIKKDELKTKKKDEDDSYRNVIINYKLSVLIRELENVLKKPNFLSLKTWVKNYFEIVDYYKLDFEEMYAFMVNNMKKLNAKMSLIEKASKYYFEEEGIFNLKNQVENKENDEYVVVKKSKDVISDKELNELKKRALNNISGTINVDLDDKNSIEKTRFIYIKEYLLKLREFVIGEKEKIQRNYKINSLTSILLNLKSRVIKKSEGKSKEENVDNNDTDIKKGVSLIK